MARRDVSSPTQKWARLRRLALVLAVPTLAMSAIAGTASAAEAADVGVIVDTPSGGNAKVRSTPTTATEDNVVEVLRDGASLADAECRLRTEREGVWTKLTGERFIRADMTGYDPRLPMCGAEAVPSTRISENVERHGLGDAASNEYSYHHTMAIGDLDPRTLGVSPETIMSDLMADFNTFQFPGCGPQIWPRKQCVISVFGLDTPIQIDRVWSTGFEFSSLPGHVEGPGRTITFNFLWNERGNGLLLDVKAVGPRPTGAVDFRYHGIPVGLFLNGEVARGSWKTFADNLGARNRLHAFDYFLDNIQP